jgi:hypothetical protein
VDVTHASAEALGDVIANPQRIGMAEFAEHARQLVHEPLDALDVVVRVQGQLDLPALFRP